MAEGSPYDNGGFLPTGITRAVNATGTPEPVSSFRWHVLSECSDEAACPIHGRNDDPGPIEMGRSW